MKNIIKPIQKIALIITVGIVICSAIFSSEIDSIYAANDRVVAVGQYNIHHLSDDGICGATQFFGDYINYEGIYGLKVHCDKTVIQYTMYSHTTNCSNGNVKLDYNGISNTLIDLGDIQLDETKTIDITEIMNKMQLSSPIGLYHLSLNTDIDSKDISRISLFYDGKKIQACQENSQSQHDVDKWNALTKNINPNTCLSMYVGNKGNPITYPTSGTGGACNHVQKWCDLSDEIITIPDWSDEMKVFALVLYLTKNYAYDDYRVSNLNNTSRAMKDNAWTDDNHFMYFNKVGQCWDFANALTIMCRHQGIPCTSVENEGHTVNAVYMSGEWIAIDVSSLVSNHCDTEDTDPKNWKHYRTGAYNQYYGYYDSTMDTYNQALATPETTLSNRSGKNPM